MALFLLIYISVYGGIHLYALIKLRKGFVLGATPVSLMALFMLLMVVAPIVTRITERWGYEALSRGLAYIAFIWMGLLFVFISSSFFFDVYRGLLYLAKALSHRPLAAFSLSSRTIGTITLLFSIAAATYGYFEALTIRTEKIAINTDKLPANIDRLRIVQISDVHLGVIVGAARFKRIINKVVSAQPDLLVSTGDLVDGPMADAEALIELIQRIPATYGKFAVTGNHEFYSGLSQSMAFTEKAGFTVLRGEGVTIADTLNIVGVDDPARGYREPRAVVSEAALLQNMPVGRFTLLLKHQPLINRASRGHFDLQLSGHTHKGQIFPFSLVTKLYYGTHTGLVKVRDTAWLYISRGSGTWGPPIRILSPPEVTVIDLINGKDQN